MCLVPLSAQKNTKKVIETLNAVWRGLRELSRFLVYLPNKCLISEVIVDARYPVLRIAAVTPQGKNRYLCGVLFKRYESIPGTLAVFLGRFLMRAGLLHSFL